MIEENFKLRTKRLILRQYQLDDFEIWKKSYLNLPAPKNRWDKGPEDEKNLTKRKFIKMFTRQKNNCKKDLYYDFIAFDKKNKKIIGYACLMDVSRGIFQNAYIGYRIFSPMWGKGYGKEIVETVLKIAFKKLKLHRIEAGIEPSNKRSIALAKSAGMKREGLSKKRLFLDGKWKDMSIYAMTLEEYKNFNYKKNNLN